MWQDYETLVSAYAKLQKEAMIVNERTERLSQSQRLLEIQTAMEGYRAFEDNGFLFAPKRRYIGEAVFTVKEIPNTYR